MPDSYENSFEKRNFYSIEMLEDLFGGIFSSEKENEGLKQALDNLEEEFLVLREV